MAHKGSKTICEQQSETANLPHPKWKVWLFYKIKRLLNITDIYPFWFNKKGKYYDIINGEFVKKQKPV